MIQEEVKKIGDEIKNLEEEESVLNEKIQNLLLNIPNIPQESTPFGKSEAENIVVKTVTILKNTCFQRKNILAVKIR